MVQKGNRAMPSNKWFMPTTTADSATTMRCCSHAHQPVKMHASVRYRMMVARGMTT